MLSSFRSIVCQVVACGRRLKTKENFKLLALKVVAVAYESTLGSRGYFFLIDISRQSRVNEAQSAEEKKLPLVTGARNLISMRDPDQISHQSHTVKLFDVANQGHCHIVNSLRTWEYPIGDPVQFLNWISHGNEVACSCDQRLFFLLGALRLVNAASPRNIDQKKISSGTQGITRDGRLQEVSNIAI